MIESEILSEHHSEQMYGRFVCMLYYFHLNIWSIIAAAASPALKSAHFFFFYSTSNKTRRKEVYFTMHLHKSEGISWLAEEGVWLTWLMATGHYFFLLEDMRTPPKRAKIVSPCPIILPRIMSCDMWEFFRPNEIKPKVRQPVVNKQPWKENVENMH